MKTGVRRNPRLLIILMASYIFAQFVWWTILLIKYNPARKWMVISEGSVFIFLLGLGIATIYRTIRHEIKLARMQKNFLLSVTHELKTPVAAGKLYLQTLLKHTFDREKQHELLHKSIKENERLTTLIDKVLLATTLDSSSLPVYRTRQDLSGVVEAISTGISESIGNQHQWEFRIAKGIDFIFDRESLQSILQNLLENAIKYSAKESLIAVELSSSAQKIKLSVSDRGAGIAKKDLPYIFDKFYRSGNEDTRSAKGTGLGLFIVKHLAGLHNGTINYEPNPEGGSIFSIEFNQI
ncbi:MAG: ATP-binding protein [Bacteroidota bacterium]